MAVDGARWWDRVWDQEGGGGAVLVFWAVVSTATENTVVLL